MGQALVRPAFTPRMLIAGGTEDERLDLLHGFMVRGYHAFTFRTMAGLLDYLNRAPANLANPTCAVLFSWSGDNAEATRMMRELRETHPQLPIVVLSSKNHDLTVLEAARRGALAVIERSLPATDVVECVARLTVDSAER